MLFMTVKWIEIDQLVKFYEVYYLVNIQSKFVSQLLYTDMTRGSSDISEAIRFKISRFKKPKEIA